MNFRKGIANLFYSIGNAFESARNTSARGNPNSVSPTDAKFELPSYTRSELVRKARYLEKNSGHIRGVLRDLKVYGIGRGIYPNAKSGNSSWDKQAEEWFFRWSRHCDITNRFSWRECQAMVLRALVIDGEVFVVKTFDSFGIPKIQIIESHRLMSPDHSDNPLVCDGIEFDRYGRAKYYYFLIGETNTVKIPASAVLHIFDPERASQARAYPQIQHSINDVIDRKEILALEKKKVKAISDIVHVLKGGNISLDGDYKVDVGNRSEGTTPEIMNRILGGKNIRIETDESIDIHESNVPSPTFSGFLSELDRSATTGILPFEFAIDPSKIGGASVRLIASKTQRYVDDIAQTIDERFNNAVWFFAVGWAITSGELPLQKWWWYCTWTHPRKLTVDAGREEQQNRANVEMGLKTLEESFAECGLDFEDEMRTRASNARFIMDLAGIPREDPIPLWMLYKVNGTQVISKGISEAESEEDKGKKMDNKGDGNDEQCIF